MDDDEKAELASKGLAATELLDPGKLVRRARDAVADSAKEAALQRIARLGALVSPPRSPARQRAVAAVDIGPVLADWDRADSAEFERRLQDAAERKADADEAARVSLAELRRSFPAESRELALVIFNCVDLLEDLSEDVEGEPGSTEELERKEELLQRIAELLAPAAGTALRSFVEHVVALSRARRGA